MTYRMHGATTDSTALKSSLGIAHAQASFMISGEAITLIERAALATESDWARQCLVRASALLRRAPNATLQTASSKDTGFARTGLAHWQLRRVTAYVEARLDESMRTTDLATIARLSTSHFFRAFKISVGMTPAKYIMRRRLSHACDLLKVTERALSQVAVDCGFCDQAHLCRSFHRFIGSTPSAWRRQHARGPKWPLGRLERESHTTSPRDGVA